MWSNSLASERTLASVMVGIAERCGLAISLARIPLRLPLFCLLMFRLWRFHCREDPE